VAGLTSTAVGAVPPTVRAQGRLPRVRRRWRGTVRGPPPSLPRRKRPANSRTRCPEVDAHRKARLVTLSAGGGYENRTVPVRGLCIPPSRCKTGRTARVLRHRGDAASRVDRSRRDLRSLLAYDYGTVLGSEARRQGIDAVQGPNLNLAECRIPDGSSRDSARTRSSSRRWVSPDVEESSRSA